MKYHDSHSLWHVEECDGEFSYVPFDEDIDSGCSHLKSVLIDAHEIAWFVRVKSHYDDMQNRLAELRREQETPAPSRPHTPGNLEE